MIDTATPATTAPTATLAAAYKKAEDGYTVVASDDVGRLVLAALATRIFVPMGQTDGGKTIAAVAAPPGTAGATTAAAALMAAGQSTDTAFFVDKAILIPDLVSKPIVMTKDSSRIREYAKREDMFWFGGARPSLSALSASMFGLPVWSWLAVGGIGAIAMFGRKRGRRY